MKQCLLLFLSSDRLHAQHMAGENIATQRDFSDSADDRENFALFVMARRIPTYFLVDLIEEDFRQEQIPHLRGGAKAALLKRKFEQFYRGSLFCNATLLARQKTGRRDDDMLFSALTNPALVLPWLEILLAQQVPLAGIYSVPHISAPLVKDNASNHMLLISWERSAGLRQTYFRNHRLQISRLSPVHSSESFQEAVLKELPRTFQYLKSLSLLPVGQVLDVRIICHHDDRDALQTQLPHSADMRYDLQDIEILGKQLKIDLGFTDSDASQLFIHQLISAPPKENYAQPEHRRFSVLSQIRQLLYLASVLIILGGLLWSASDFWQSHLNQEQLASLQLQTQRIAAETKQVQLTLPSTVVTPAEIKSAVTTMRVLEANGPIPQDILQPIASALDTHPRIYLDEFTWQLSSSEAVAANTRADVAARVVLLKGHLEDFEHNYRDALNYLDQFQKYLSQHGYVVQLLEKPLDISSTGNLGDAAVNTDNALNFSIQLVWRPTL